MTILRGGDRILIPAKDFASFPVTVELPRFLSGAPFKSYPALVAAQHLVSFFMLSSDTRALGRCMDVVWCDINVVPE